MLLSRLVVGILAGGLMVADANVAFGQDYPSKPIRIITSAAGGGGDFTARQIAQGISGPLGQPVIVDNRTGTLAAEALSKAPPDGYTVSVSGASTWIGPLLRKLPWDVEKDFAPITLTDRQPSVLAVHPSVPAKSVKELIALAKAKPGELNYGSGASGSGDHLATELFKHMADVNIVRIAYKGDAQGITALIGGEVQMYIKDAGLLMPHVKAGKLRALAVTSAEPSTMAPGLPTIAASGLPGYQAVSMTGMFAPAKTPAQIINRLNQEIVRVLKQPEVRERLLAFGSEVVASSPEQFGAAVKSDTSTMGKLIKDAGIKAE